VSHADGLPIDLDGEGRRAHLFGNRRGVNASAGMSREREGENCETEQTKARKQEKTPAEKWGEITLALGTRIRLAGWLDGPWQLHESKSGPVLAWLTARLRSVETSRNRFRFAPSGAILIASFRDDGRCANGDLWGGEKGAGGIVRMLVYGPIKRSFFLEIGRRKD
jgi:hypothetical protein